MSDADNFYNFDVNSRARLYYNAGVQMAETLQKLDITRDFEFIRYYKCIVFAMGDLDEVYK